MKRKGISPLIAAVLLIAFTMAVASLFAQWAPSVIGDLQSEAGNQSQQLANCAEYGITIDADTADSSTAVVSQSRGPEGVGNVSVTWIYESADPLRTTIELTGNGDAVQASVSGSGNTWSEITAQSIRCDQVRDSISNQ